MVRPNVSVFASQSMADEAAAAAVGVVLALNWVAPLLPLTQYVPVAIAASR